MALGAFVAGLLLAETEYHRAIEATIDPFKGLLLGVFFFSVGMSLDVAYLWSNPLPILFGLVGLIVIKSGVLVVLLRLFRVPWPATIETATLLGPGGEFAFIVIGLAVAKKIVEPGMGEVVLAITSFSMALVPVLDYFARRMGAGRRQSRSRSRCSACRPRRSTSTPSSSAAAASARLVSEMLTRHGVKHIIVEKDPRTVARGREEGFPVYFGDAKNPLFLKRCGIEEAKGVVITINKPRRSARSSPPCAGCAATSSSSPARAMPSTHASSTSRSLRRRAGDHRGKPAALRGDARRSRRADGSRSSPRSTRSATSSASSCRVPPAGRRGACAPAS